MAARAFIMLQSSIATFAGLALLAAPRFYPRFASALFTAPLKNNATDLSHFVALLLGVGLIFVGGALCTAGGAVNAHICKSLSTGYVVIAGAFGWLWFNQGTLGSLSTPNKLTMTPMAMISGLAFFSCAALLTMAVAPAPAAVPALAASGKAADKAKKDH